MQFEANISPLIPDQFPSFYDDDESLFIPFVQAYYEWMEQSNNVINLSRNLLSYRDIDKTIDDFIVHFKLKYLNNIQFDTATNKRLIVKHSGDLYRAKGTERGLELFFKLVYAEPISFYYPKKDIFRLSDNEWVIPYYLEVTDSQYTDLYAGQEITGAVSGATAFVDRIVRRKASAAYITIFHISNIKGSFQKNEPLQISGNTNVTGVPFFLGCLTDLTVVGPGTGFSVGDIVNIVSNNGSFGQGLVTETLPITSTVNFSLFENGYGYSNTTATVLISDHVLSLTNVQVSNTNIRGHEFYKWETIKQPLCNISFTTAGGTFVNGDIIENWSSGIERGVGQILIANQATGASNGTLYVSITSGNLDFQSVINKQGNAFTAVISSYTDTSATANVMGFNANGAIHSSNLIGTYQSGELITQRNSSNVIMGTAIVNSVTVVSSSNVTILFNNLNGLFFSNLTIVGNISNAQSKVTSWDTKIGIINTSGTFTNLAFNYLYGTTSNTTATVARVSTGFGATLNIGMLGNTENIWFNTDYLAANNTGGIPYMNIFLSGTNSNVASNGYGFPANPTYGISNRIIDCLSYVNETIGSVESLRNVNPGTQYNDPPMIELLEKYVASMWYWDDIIQINQAQSSGSFAISGEIITQTVTLANTVQLHYNNLTGSFKVGEFIYQSNGTANVATGILFDANSTVLRVNSVSGTFVVPTYLVSGLTSGATANIVSIDSVISGIAKGWIRPGLSNSSTFFVKRMSFTQDFSNTAPIIGALSAASANVLSISKNYTSNVMGDNALVNSNVVIANGGVADLSVYDSGIGYVDNELDAFVSLDGTRQGLVQVSLENQGFGKGYFKNDNGFLSDGKYLYDGEYYQTFSYVVKSSLPFEKYANMVKQVMHVAGLKLFGQIYKISIANNSVVSRLSSSLVQSNSGITWIETGDDLFFLATQNNDPILYVGSAPPP
jgi:hypothetical protein